MMDSSSKLVKYLESLDNVSSSILYHEIENHESAFRVGNKLTTSNYSPHTVAYTQNLNGDKHKDLMDTRFARNVSPNRK